MLPIDQHGWRLTQIRAGRLTHKSHSEDCVRFDFVKRSLEHALLFELVFLGFVIDL